MGGSNERLVMVKRKLTEERREKREGRGWMSPGCVVNKARIWASLFGTSGMHNKLQCLRHMHVTCHFAVFYYCYYSYYHYYCYLHIYTISLQLLSVILLLL